MNPLKRLGGAVAAVCMAVSVCAVPSLAISIEPTNDFFVYDGANVLTDETEQYIVEKNAGLSQQTGAQIVVVTVENTEGYSCEDYAYEIGNSWGVGSAKENNGVVLLLDIGSEDYQCIQGSGLSRTLTTPTLSRILQEKLEPDFAAADYDAGVRKTFDALFSEVSSIYGYAGTPSGTVIPPQTTPNEERSSGRGIFGMLSTVIVFVAVIVFISAFSKAARSGNTQYRNNGTPYGPNGTPYVGGQPTRQNNSAMPFILGMLLGSSRNHHHHRHDDDDHFGGFGGFGGGGFGGGGFGGGGGGFGGGGGGGFGGGGGGFGGGGAGRGH